MLVDVTQDIGFARAARYNDSGLSDAALYILANRNVARGFEPYLSLPIHPDVLAMEMLSRTAHETVLDPGAARVIACNVRALTDRQAEAVTRSVERMEDFRERLSFACELLSYRAGLLTAGQVARFRPAVRQMVEAARTSGEPYLMECDLPSVAAGRSMGFVQTLSGWLPCSGFGVPAVAVAATEGDCDPLQARVDALIGDAGDAAHARVTVLWPPETSITPATP